MKDQKKYGEWVIILYYILLGITVLFSLILTEGTAIFIIPLFATLFAIPTLYKSQRKKIDKEQNAREWDIYQRELNAQQWNDYYQQQATARENQLLQQEELIKKQANIRENQLLQKEESLKEQANNIIIQQKVLENKNEIFDSLRVIDEHLLHLVPIMDGETYERYVGYMLLRNGWTSIQYTPITGDNGADIIAVSPSGTKTCIQCKHYSGSVGVDAVQQALGGAVYYNCDAAVVITNSEFTKQAKEFAQKTNVQLFDLMG